MQRKLQTTKIFLSILGLFILSCGPVTDLIGTPVDPEANPDLQPGETPTTGQSADIISADNALDLVEIAAWGKGSGHHPTYSPDGRILATTGENMKLWDAASGQELASLSMNNVYSLAFSPDGKLILAGSTQGMSLWGVQP